MTKNQDIYLDFQTNPSLAQALADANPGDEIKMELTVMVKSKDDKGLSGTIEPGSVVPDGYEPDPDDKEDGGSPDDDDTTANAPQPPGSLATPPVVSAMNLRKKGTS